MIGWNKQKLMKLPDLVEPKNKAITEMIISNCPAMYINRPNLMVYYIKHIVYPGLKYGLSSGFEKPVGYIQH